jgi:type IVB pilus formation R64 PilN family outer membrane protein
MNRTLGIVLTVIFLNGCTMQQKLENMINSDISRHNQKLSQTLYEARKNPVIGNPKVTALKLNKGYWVSPVEYELENPLPKIFHQPVVYRWGQAQDIEHIGANLTKITGKIVHIAPEILVNLTRTESLTKADSTGTTTNNASTNITPKSRTIEIDYQHGDLFSLLNYIASAMNVSWRYDTDKDQIQFYLFETRTFRIAALHGGVKVSSVVSNTVNKDNARSGASIGTISGSEHETTIATSFDIWRDIKNNIEVMLSPGGVMRASESTASITITDSTEALDRVETYVSQLNIQLSQSVQFYVRVMNVQTSSNGDYGVNWNAILSSSKGAISFATERPVSAGLSTITGVLLGNSAARNTQVFVDALSSQGEVSVLTDTTINTLNHQPAPLQVGKNTSFIAKNEFSEFGNEVVSTAELGNVITGFSIILQPNILDEKNMLVHIAMDRSELTNLKQVNTGQVTLEAPEIENTSSIQRVVMQSGETIVLSGFEENSNRLDKSGMGDADNFMLGGNHSAEHKRNVIVILITPLILS